MTDDSVTDTAEASASTGASRLRELAAVAGLGVIGSLAGCAAEPGQTDDGSAVGSPTRTGSQEPTSAPTATLTAETCLQRAAELEPELASVGEAIEQLGDDLQTLDRRHRNLEEVTSLFEPPDAEVERQALAVGSAAREAVVFLDLGGGTATGWYIDDHHIITNAHNVAGLPVGDAGAATAWTLGGDGHPAEPVASVASLDPDVAVMRTDERAPATLPTGSAPDDGSTETLVQVGNPGGVGNWVITFGHLRGTHEVPIPGSEPYTVLESTVPGRQGVSGSPVLNLDGDVVGLTYSGSDVQTRPPESPPMVAEPTVYDQPIAALSYANHLPIDTVMTYYEEWT